MLDNLETPWKGPDYSRLAHWLDMDKYALSILMELISQTVLRVEIIHGWVVQGGDCPDDESTPGPGVAILSGLLPQGEQY
jgi:hypothetical protein